MSVTTINAYGAREFRAWLRRNHKKEHKVAVILHKRHTGKTAPTHRQMIEEAICFGWIDTTIKRLDEDTFLRHFSKRTPNSRWSDNTLSYAKRLIKEKKMMPQGLEFYKMGLAKPTHDHGIPKDPPMPLELTKALSKNKIAKKNFDTYPPSSKKMLYRWLLHAKLPETRAKRINRIIQGASKGTRNIL